MNFVLKNIVFSDTLTLQAEFHEKIAPADEHCSIIDESCAKQSLSLNASAAHYLMSEPDEHPVTKRLHRLARQAFSQSRHSLWAIFFSMAESQQKIW